MTYSKVYNKAIKYAAAPIEGIKNFTKQSADNDIFSAHNSSDPVFADWLEEHDDPRHLIVRRDLEIRGKEQDEHGNPLHSYTAKSNLDRRERFPNTIPHRSQQIDFHDGTELTTTPWLDESNQVAGHKVVWYVPKTGDAGSHSYLGTFDGHLTPEEFDHILANVPHHSKDGNPHSTSTVKKKIDDLDNGVTNI